MDFDQPVLHIMTEDPVTVRSDQKLSDARKLLAESNIHHLPVVEGDKLAGIVSSSDLVKLSLIHNSGDGSFEEFLDRHYTIESVMERHPTTVAVDATIREAANLLSVGAFHALPVVGYNNVLRGIVTSTDMINMLITRLY